MPYIRKRGSSYYYTVEAGTNTDGSRKQITKGGFRTKKMAEDAAFELVVELNKGTYIEKQDILFSEFANQWLELYSAEVKAGSVRIRRHEIAMLNRHFGNTKVRDIDQLKYEAALVRLKKEGYAKNTIDGAHCTAKMIFKKARQSNIIKNDPTEFAKKPRVRKTEEQIERERKSKIEKYLEKDELALFLKTADAKGLGFDYAMFLTLAYTGIRSGELCALKWKDIDFTQGTINIDRTLYNPSNNMLKYVTDTPKTDASARTIEIDKTRVCKELEKLKDFQKAFKQSCGSRYHDDDFVFVNLRKHPGYPIIPKHVENRMNRILKLAGLNQELTPHSLRHTHTSLLAEAGVPLEEIMRRLGQVDDETTVKVYLHVTKKVQSEACSKFSGLMDDAFNQCGQDVSK